MAAYNNKPIILVFLICLLPHIVFSFASAKDNDTKAYVDSWCQKTSYQIQELCVHMLTPYVRSRANLSPEDLVRFVLKETLNLVMEIVTRFEKVSRPKDENPSLILTSEDVLNPLLKKVGVLISQLIKLASGSDGVGAKKYINLQRRTSTALTDLETLVSKFQGRRLSKLDATIYAKVKNVEETTSNALAIVRQYAATRH